MAEDQPPTRADHLQFCLNEGWWLVHEGVGDAGPEHLTYQLDLLDGRSLRTRVHTSSADSVTAPESLQQLLSELQCSAREFWSCVQQGIPPDRLASPYQAVHLERRSPAGLDADFLVMMAERSRRAHPGPTLGGP